MKSQASIVIDRPIEEVFKQTTEHVSDWSRMVVEDVVIEDKEGGVGTTFRSVTEERGRTMEFLGLVTAHDPPQFHAAELMGDHFDIFVEYSFEDLGRQTRVTQVSNVHGHGIFKFVLSAMGWLMPKAGNAAALKELQYLKDYCEGTGP